MAGGCNCLYTIWRFCLALFYLVIVFPISAVIAIIAWIFQMIGYSWWFFILLLAALAGAGITRYHNVLNSRVEFVFRCYVEPIWTGLIRPIFMLAEVLYNSCICFWDSFWYFAFGYMNDTVYPGLLNCGGPRLLKHVLPVIAAFFNDFVVSYILSGAFLVNGVYDATNLGIACVNLLAAWTDMWCCLCMDLCVLFRCAPIPVLYFMYPFIQISGYLNHLDFYLAVGAAVNLLGNIFQQVIRLIVEIFTVGFANLTRPDLEVASFSLCKLAFHFVNATELVIQCFWDSFIPYEFNWIDALCVVDSLVCVAGDFIVFTTRMLFNVDTIFLDMFTPNPATGHGPRPGSIWHGSMVIVAKRFFNTISPITNPKYAYDVALLGRSTVAACLCVLVRRIICDPSDTNTACFSNAAASFLENFDFCCLFNAVLRLANDFSCGLYDLFQNATDADTFFIWVDDNPNYDIIIGTDGDVVEVIKCLLSSLQFIPVVGFCLKNVFVSLLAFVTGMINFAVQGVLSLPTLPYFLLVLGRNNKLLRPGELLELYSKPIRLLIEISPSSFLNCLCFVLNSIHIPPITLDIYGNFVPCGCQAVGFIPPPAVIDKMADAFDWKDDFLETRFKKSIINKLTPILVYEIEKNITGQGHRVINPIYLKERILENMALYGATVIPELARNVDAFIEMKTREFRSKWDKIKMCQHLRAEAEELRVKSPWRYKYLVLKERLPGQQEGCTGFEEFLIPFGSSGPIDQMAYDYGILHNSEYAEVVMQEVLKGRNSTFFEKLASKNPAVLHWERYAKEHMSFTPLNSEEWERAYNNTSNITVSTTIPAVLGCPAPGEPLLPCFDLCCILRTSFQLLAHILLASGRLVNALIQGNFQQPGWQYFTGVSCPACFEVDLVQLVRFLVAPIACGCRLFDLILPSSPNFPRPDLCCGITYIGDFVGGILQTIINSIKSLALDSPNFFYFVEGGFINDANVLFDLTLRIVACICNVVRYAFPVYQLTGGGFDPCCIAENLAIFLVELQRLILQMIVNLALIVASPTAVDYWRDPGIGRGYAIMDNIGVIKQADVVIDALFGKAGGICSDVNRDQGVGGISQCVCQILSTIIPVRPRPDLPITDPDNCPIFDICCPVRGISLVLGEWTRFSVRLLATTWQSWSPQDYGKPPGAASPIAFLDFFFCDEEDPAKYPGCGKLDPTVTAFINVLVSCPCQFGELADAWLTDVLPAHNFQCFCGATDGFFTNVGGLVENLTRAIVTLIRRISDPLYWAFNQGGPAVNSIKDSWIFRFAGPSINSICNLVTSVLCVTNSIIGLPCTEYQKRIVRSIVRWILESLLRFGAFVQGFILIFASGVNSACPPPTQCPENGKCPAGNYCTPTTGVCDTPCPSGTAGSTNISVAQLANAFVSLFSYVFDLLIGDSTVLCSVLNPPMCDPTDPCCCYNPAGSYKFQPIGGIFTEGRQCAQCINPKDNCTLLVNSFAFPTCVVNPCKCDNTTTTNPMCDSQTGCYKPKQCVNVALISCDPYNPNLTPLDGIVLAVLRYMRCMIARLISNDLAKAFDAIISLLSFIWQIFTPILRFLASLVLFVILLFGFLNGGCACFNRGTAQYVQRGGLCYPCEEQPDIRVAWWSDSEFMHNGAWEPKPNNGTTWAGEICIAGFSYPAGAFLNKTNIRAIDNRMCIDTILAGGPGGCPPGCGPFAANASEYPAKCQICNAFNNDRGEVGCSADCNLFGGRSCTLCGANPMVLCGIIQLWEAFGDIFRSFIDVFTKPPINPEPPAGKRDGAYDPYEDDDAEMAHKRRRQAEENDPDFKPWHYNYPIYPANARKRMWSSRKPFNAFKREADTDLTSGIFTGGNAIRMMVAAAWDYDITDCPYDLRTCVCRNRPIPSAACSTGTPELERAMRTRDPKMIDDLSAPVIAYLADEAAAGGTTRCEYLLANFSNYYRTQNVTWSMLSMSERVEYIGCLDKMIQGERLHTVYPAFPKKYFYTNTGPVDFLANIQADATHQVKKSREYNAWDHEFEMKKKRSRDPKLDERELTMKRDLAIRRQKILDKTSKDPRWENSMVLSFFLELDEYEYKFRSGWFRRNFGDAMYNIKYGTWSLSFAGWWDAVKDQTYTNSQNVYQATWRRTIDDLYRGFGASMAAIDDVWERGPYKMWMDVRERMKNSPESVANRKRAEAIRNMTRGAWYNGPIYKWWTGKERTGTYLDYKNPFGVFADHMVRNWNFHRANWETMPASGMTIDLHLKKNFADTIGKRWTLKWTPQKLANWASIARVFSKIGELIDPNRKTALVVPLDAKDKEKGFIVDGNCYLMDGLIDQVVFLVSYCANDFMINFPTKKRMELSKTYMGWRWIERMADHGERNYAPPADRTYIPDHFARRNATSSEPVGKEEDEWTNAFDWVAFRGLNWIRQKVRPHPGNTARREHWEFLRHLTRRQWKRAVASAPLDVTNWFIALIDRIFNINLQMEVAIIVGKIEDFIANDNLDYMAAPVGLYYWVLFPLRCQVKPGTDQLPSNAFINLNCRVGMGIEQALGYTLLAMLILFVISTILLPSLFNGMILFLLFIVVFPAMAWHYSPRCWLMTPALSVGGITGVSVPLWPLPLAPPALPFCLLSEVRFLLDKYIVSCYRVLWGTNLEFLFPPYMIPGEACPLCPELVTMSNCGDLGWGGGVANFVYILNHFWPGSTLLAKEIVSLWPFQPGHFLEGLGNDILVLFNQVNNLTPLQSDQYYYCNILTFTTLASVLIVAVFAWTLLGVLWGILIDGLFAAWNLTLVSPLMYLLPGSDNTLYQDYFGTEEDGIYSDNGGGGSPYEARMQQQQQPPAYIGVRFGNEFRNGRRVRHAVQQQQQQQQPARRRPHRSVVFGWMDDVRQRIGHAFKAIKRD